MNKKLLKYMDEHQKRTFHDEQSMQGGIRRLLGLVRDKFGGPLKWAAWKLWGRRRAIRRMQKLALSGESYYTRPTTEQELKRLADHRRHLDSLKVGSGVPAPDTTDLN